jgi:GNAT superfamily N-acetyltransferase
MIRYTEDLAVIDETMLAGFFVGWPRCPSARQHLAALRGSFRAVVAIDDSHGRVAGFVNMISDGVLTAFIPWLEVLMDYQGHGIGTELMRRVLDTDQFYSIDLACDEPLLTCYSSSGWSRFGAPVCADTLPLRARSRQVGCSRARRDSDPVPRPRRGQRG